MTYPNWYDEPDAAEPTAGKSALEKTVDDLEARVAALEASPANMLAEFHGALGQPFGHGSVHDSALRRALHDEEHCELIEALCSRDIVAVAQELADVVYVAYGTAHALGIPLDAVLAEVHRANMSKFGEDGRPVLRADGKLLKAPGWKPPNVASVLVANGAWPEHVGGCDGGDGEGPGCCDPDCPRLALARALAEAGPW